MELTDKRKVRIIFRDKNGKLSYKNKTVYETPAMIRDKDDRIYQIYLQDKLEFVSDIRVNNPNVGIVVGQYFCSLGTYETYRDMKETIEKTVSSFNIKESFIQSVKGKLKDLVLKRD